MQSKTDDELLQAYSQSGSEEAFGEVVRRYADFVYSAAARQVGSSELAHDVAQAVFTDLARKAGSFSRSTMLIAWLCGAVRLASLQQLRKDRRRANREQFAMDWHEANSEDQENWQEIRPLLDEAIARLHDADRKALLVRYFKNESLAAVGSALGISEDAAQKRIARALGKLRDYFSRHGVTTTVAALSAAISTHAIQAAPANFSSQITSVALAKVAAQSSATALSTLFQFARMKSALPSILLAGGVAVLGYYLIASQNELQQTKSNSQRQFAQVEELRAANQQLSLATNELDRLRKDSQDVLRLRSEVSRLRNELASSRTAAVAASPPQTNAPTPPVGPPVLITSKFLSIPTESLGDFANLDPGQFQLLPETETAKMLQTLEKIQGVELLSAPRVSTSSGVEARLSVSQEVPVDGTNATAGLMLTVNPHYSTNSPEISMEVSAEIDQTIRNSNLPDASAIDLRKTVITNSMSFLEGQSIVLRREVETGAHLLGSTNLTSAHNTLLVFINSSIVHQENR